MSIRCLVAQLRTAGNGSVASCLVFFGSRLPSSEKLWDPSKLYGLLPYKFRVIYGSSSACAQVIMLAISLQQQ